MMMTIEVLNVDLINGGTFNIALKCAGESWEINRSNEEIDVLLGKLLKYPDAELCEAIKTTKNTSESPSQLKHLLMIILERLGDGVWLYQPLLHFIDSSKQSILTSLEVEYLQRRVLEMTKQIDQCMESIANLVDIVNKNQAIFLKLGYQTTSPTFQGANTADDRNNESLSSSLHDSNIGKFSNYGGQVLPLEEGGPQSTPPLSDTDISSTTVAFAAVTEFGGSFTKQQLKEKLLSLTPAVGNLESRCVVNIHRYDGAVKAFADLFEPCSSHMTYRASIHAFIQLFVRTALNASAFPCGLHEINSALPDDPIRLTVIMSPSRAADWQKRLSECMGDFVNKSDLTNVTSIDSMSKFSSPLTANRTLMGNNYNFGVMGSQDFGTAVPFLDHEIDSVSVGNETNSFTVVCGMDSKNEVIISCNQRENIILACFLQEIDQLVGKDSLFKRSLLLIRAWWAYEASVYAGAFIKDYLSYNALSIMICAIFNNHHSVITSPLQALSLFLAEYVDYDASVSAITLQGIVPFETGDNSQPVLRAPEPHQIISEVIIEKYWHLFHLKSAVASAPYKVLPLHVSFSPDDINKELTTGAFFSRGHSPESVQLYLMKREQFDANVRAGSSNPRPHSVSQLPRFERSSFNVVHPFTFSNMVRRATPSSLAPRRATRLETSFRYGAAALAMFLSKTVAGNVEIFSAIDDLQNIDFIDQVQIESGPSDITDDSIVTLFKQLVFPVAFEKYGDVHPAEAHLPIALLERMSNDRIANAMNRADLKSFSAENLVKGLLYANFVMETAVSEWALLMVCSEILMEKQVQPVGEIGKVLAEMTNSPNLSFKLKALFGGLKKFLEKRDDMFVFCHDHPYNPQVTLRTILQSNNLYETDNGVQQMLMILKGKKSTWKKGNSSGSSSPSVGNRSLTTFNINSFKNRGTVRSELEHYSSSMDSAAQNRNISFSSFPVQSRSSHQPIQQASENINHHENFYPPSYERDDYTRGLNFNSNVVLNREVNNAGNNTDHGLWSNGGEFSVNMDHSRFNENPSPLIDLNQRGTSWDTSSALGRNDTSFNIGANQNLSSRQLLQQQRHTFGSSHGNEYEAYQPQRIHKVQLHQRTYENERLSNHLSLEPNGLAEQWNVVDDAHESYFTPSVPYRTDAGNTTQDMNQYQQPQHSYNLYQDRSRDQEPRY